MAPHVWARFDDLRAQSAAYFPGVARVVSTMRPGEVGEVLAEVDRSTTAGGWAFGFVSYEAASGLDPNLAVHRPVDGLPVAWFGICGEPVVVPVVTALAVSAPVVSAPVVSAPVVSAPVVSAPVVSAPVVSAPVGSAPVRPGYSAGPWSIGWTAEQHQRAVEAVRAAIAGGDTYQVNLTTRLTAPVRGELPHFYADLALRQRGSYNAYLDVGRFVIAGASPELFFEIREGRLRTRPMKGTAPRGRTRAEDVAFARLLRDSTKDRAENIMIVDLMRNDLAQIASTGTVEVAELCRLESYETVHQLVSEINARLRPGVGLADVFRALFPSGSVTGAPKIPTMRLIHQLEAVPRGVYCGAVGVVAPPGSAVRARFNVAIRTVVVDRATDTAVYGTGGGITWASDPDAEYAELLTKANLLPAFDAMRPLPAIDAKPDGCR